MGRNIYKVDYECDCGKNYGSCGEQCSYVMVMYRSSDTYAIYHKSCESKTYSNLEFIGDNALSALIKVLTTDKEISQLEFSSEELEQLNLT